MTEKQDGMSRRDFGKKTALGASAITSFSILSNKVACAEDKMTLGLIGAGGRGSGAVGNAIQASSNIDLVAVADFSEERAKSVVGRFKNNENLADNINVDPANIGWGLDGYKKVIAMKPDYIILATPPGFRPEHFEAVVDAKINCFCEKPTAVDSNGTRRFLAAAKRSEQLGLHVVGGTQRRHQKPYIETINKIHDGVIGEVVSGRAYWNGTLPHARDRKPGMSDLEYQLYNWYNFCWICGDNIVEQHVHNLDIMNWVFKSHPVSVVASGGRSWKPKVEKYGNIWDHFNCDYEYPNGIHVLSASRHWNNSANEVSELVQGTKLSVNNGQSNCHDMGEGGVNPYVQEHKDLQASILGTGPKLNEAVQVAESVFTAIMGRMSAYTGKKYTWDQALNEDLDIMPKLTEDGRMTPNWIPVPGGYSG